MVGSHNIGCLFLYEENYKPLYLYALSLTGNKQDAEDLLQETFVKAYLSYECEECRTYHESMTKEPPKIVLDTSNDLSEEKFFQKIDKSIHRKITQNTIIASFVLFIVLAIGLTFIPRYPNRPGFGMYGFVDERVEKEKLKVENLCQLEDGRVYFEMVCTETVTGLHIETDLYNEQNDSFYGIANYSVDKKKQCFGVEGNGSRYWFVFLPYLEDEFGNRNLVTEFFFECKDDERIEIWRLGQEIFYILIKISCLYRICGSVILTAHQILNYKSYIYYQGYISQRFSI